VKNRPIGGIGASSHMACLAVHRNRIGAKPTPRCLIAAPVRRWNDLVGGHVRLSCAEQIGQRGGGGGWPGSVKAYAGPPAGERLATAAGRCRRPKEAGINYDMRHLLGRAVSRRSACRPRINRQARRRRSNRALDEPTGPRKRWPRVGGATDNPGQGRGAKPGCVRPLSCDPRGRGRLGADPRREPERII